MRRLDVSPLRIDWFAVLTDLQRAGLPVSSVSDQLRIPKSTILGWKQGAEPRHADGEALTLLWCRITGHDRDSLPHNPEAEMVGNPTPTG